MGQALFYHLTRSTLEETLATLCERSLARGWRVVVRGDDPAQLEAVDRALWRTAPESFLPHGLAGGPHDAEQPVLLTTGPEAPNGATCLMLVGAATLGAEEAAALERVCVLFEGADPAAVDRARDLWRVLTKAGVRAEYWSQEDGPWRKKAESG